MATNRKILTGIVVTALVLVVLAFLNGMLFYLNMKARDGKASTATVKAEKDAIFAKLDSLEQVAEYGKMLADTVPVKKVRPK